MSEWNLSVRLSGQGSDLSRTLRTTSRDARTASRDVNALRRDIALLRQQTRNDLRLRVRVDADHLRADVRAALTSAGAGQGLGVNLRLTDARRLRRDISDAIRQASRGQRIQIPIVLRDPTRLRRDVDNAIRRAQNQTVRVRVVADTSDLNGIRRTLGGGGGGRGGGGSDFGLKGLLTLAPAAIPLAAGLVDTLAPLAAEFTAAGVAGAAFGIAVAGQIGPLSDAADAEQKYQQAVLQHGASSQQALEAQVAYQQQLGKMPPATQQASIALSTLKSDFTAWSDELSGFTMTPVTKGIDLLDSLIPRLTPEVQSATKELDRLVTTAGGMVVSPGFDSFAKKIEKFTDGKLDHLTDEVIHLMRVLSSGGADHGVIKEFMDYARANGPAAREAIQAIAKAILVLMQGAAMAGPSMLSLVTAAARLVAALPPELVGIILHVAAALKLLQLSGAGFAALHAGLVRVTAGIMGLRTASTAAGGGLAGLRAAFMSLGMAARATLVVAGIAAVVLVFKSLSDIGKKAPPDVDKLTTSLGKLGQEGKVAGEAARAFGKDFSGLADSLRTLSRPSNLDKTQQFLTKLVGMDSTPVADAKKDLDAVDKSLANLVQGGKADVAKAAFDQIAAAMRKQGMSGKELRKQLGDYKSALADAKFEQEMAAASMGLFGKAAQDTQAKLEAQKQSADGLRQSIQALNDVNRAAGSAMSAFEQSIDDVTKAAKKHSDVLKMNHGELDLGSQKARDAEKVLSELAANTDAAASKAREQGKSWEYVQGIMTRGQKTFVDAAQKMGLTKAQAEALAKSYLDIPNSKTTTFEMRTEDAITQLDNVATAIKKTPDKKSVTVDALTTDAATLLEGLGFKVEHLPDGRFKVTAETGTAGENLQAVETARDGLKDKSLRVDAATGGAIQSLQDVQAKIKSTNGKTIVMKAPTGAAIQALEALGFKVQRVPGSKNVRITIPTGSASQAVGTIQGYINSVHGKTVTVRINGVATGVDPSKYYSQGPHKARGGPVRGYAGGGELQHFPGGGYVQGPGSGTSDSIFATFPSGAQAMVSNTEYVIQARAVRKYGLRILNELNNGTLPVLTRLAAGGPTGIPHLASGGFTYTPTGTMKSATDVQSSYSSSHQSITKDQYTKTLRARANAVDNLHTAEAKLAQVRKHKHTHAQLVAAESRVAKARRSVATATDAARTAEARYKKQFSLADWGKTLAGAVKSNAAYEANLKKIASRGGADVVDQLRDMGAEGASMVSALAKASKAQFNSIVANLRKLAPLAKATLADYTAQLTASTKTSSTFQANLAKLAGMGYGDLATQLAAQGDDAAQKLAAEAVKSKGAAAKANKAAKDSSNTLTSDQLTELVQIIGAVKSRTTGIHEVASTTGIGEDEIIAVANKAKGQIHTSLGSRAERFLADLGKANKHLAYADGGIRAGLYATRAGAVTFAEPSTGGEAYIPLGANKRRSALPVLADVAGRFGVGLRDATDGKVIVIRQQAPLVGATHYHIGDRRSDRDLARDIDNRQAYQLRRLARGGVGAR